MGLLRPRRFGLGMSKAAAGIGGGFCSVPLLLATVGAGAGVAAGEGESPAAALVTAAAAAAGFTSGMVLLNPVKLVGKKLKSANGEKSKAHLREWDLNSIVDKRKSKGEKSMHPSSGRPRIST